jgi:Xaa-Pro aminopeptidase
MNYRDRQAQIEATLGPNQLDALLVTHLPNIRYLCGFTGSAGALLAGGGYRVFFTDGRYTEQARAEVQGARVVIARNGPLAAAAAAIPKRKIRSLGVESEHMTVAMRESLRRMLGGGARLRSTTGLVERARMIKDAGELERLRAAVLLGARLFEEVALKVIRAGVTEVKVAAEIEYAARRAGAAQMAFETIVASGPRAAMPHGRASTHAIPARGFVILDFGVILGGYCSDMTRTVHVGRPSAQARRMYAAVREAQQAGVEAVRPGATAGQVDLAARRALRRAGWGRYFTHSTGHGVGLEIHEPPRLGRGQTEVLQPGMVVTIEPGIYVPGSGGVRIEDMVVVTQRGCEVLTPATKQLLAL